MYILASFVISLSLWMYIQINNNPVIEKQITVPLQFLSEETLANNDLKTEYTIENVSIILVGRKSVMDELSDTDIGAYIDYSPVQSEGLYTLRIAINSEKNVYSRVKSQNPETLAVNAYQSGD